MGYKVDHRSLVPVLTHLKPASLYLMDNRMFGPVTPWSQDGKLYGLVMNFVRLADLAVHEYEQGRQAQSAWWGRRQKQRKEAAIVLASSHFEACVTAVHRAVRHLLEMREYSGTPLHFLAPFPSTPTVLSEGGDKDVEEMRGAIQHLEERILGIGWAKRNPVKYPSIKPGEAIAPYPRGEGEVRGKWTVQVIDRLELGGHRILFADLARWLAELNGHAHHLAEVMS